MTLKSTRLSTLFILFLSASCAHFPGAPGSKGPPATATENKTATASETAPPSPLFEALQKRAERFHSLIHLPTFEETPDQAERAMKDSLALADQELAELLKRDPKTSSFEETIGALDRIQAKAGDVSSRIYLIWNTSQNEALRDRTQQLVDLAEKWDIQMTYREDIYLFVKAFADTWKKRKLRLSSVQERLLDEYVKDYRRNGLHLPLERRQKVEAWKKELATLTLAFQNHLNTAKTYYDFSEAELQGVPLDDIKSWKQPDGKYRLDYKLANPVGLVMRNATSEETRKKVDSLRYQVAVQENVPLLRRILKMRADIAHEIGFPTWADMKLEPRMAKRVSTVMSFLKRLNEGLEPKLRAEMRELRDLKRKETRDPKAELQTWDVEFYLNLLAKTKYTLNSDALKVYFPMNQVLQGMFQVYERIFDLKFVEIDPPYRWVDDLRLFAVEDRKTKEPLGFFYLDLFPRPGKYTHFANFGLVRGKRLPDGRYERPIAVLVCNFPKPTADTPSLLLHRDVETVFHEFGHAMHHILTRAEYASFSGTSVPRDFIEAPSQMLENWVWEQKVLDLFAADYRDPKKKFPPDMLAKMENVRKSSIGMATRRQISFGLLDMDLHSRKDIPDDLDVVAITNRYLEDANHLQLQKGAAFVARFGHLMGYDAGYYGYLWAESISADLAEKFRLAPNGFLDVGEGRKLRKEIYEAGNTREVAISIERFLGRKRTLGPFLRKLGISEGTGSNY